MCGNFPCTHTCMRGRERERDPVEDLLLPLTCARAWGREGDREMRESKGDREREIPSCPLHIHTCRGEEEDRRDRAREGRVEKVAP